MRRLMRCRLRRSHSDTRVATRVRGTAIPNLERLVELGAEPA